MSEAARSKPTAIPGGLMLMPCKPGVCQECARDHTPDNPHDAQSMYYQYKFYAQHHRWPTWKDAIAHCSEEIRTLWEQALRERGAWTEPEPAKKTVTPKKRKKAGATKR